MKSTKKNKGHKSVERNSFYVGPLKPDDQLILSPQELEEFHLNALYVREPPISHNRQIFSYKENRFIPKKDKTKRITLVSIESALLHRESLPRNVTKDLCLKPEGLFKDNKNDLDNEQDEDKLGAYANNDNVQLEEEVAQESLNFENDVEEINEMDEIDEMEGEMSETKSDAKLSVTSKSSSKADQELGTEESLSLRTTWSLPFIPICSTAKLKNDFNFFSRYIQTMDIRSIDDQTQTTMNQKISYDANVSLSAIVYAIEEDIRRQKEEEEREKRNKMAALKLRNNNSDVNAVNEKQRRSVRKKLYCTQFLEKVIDFNNKSSTVFRQDSSDQFENDGEGSILLMWTMRFTEQNNLFVTAISWNPQYFDYFAVTLATHNQTFVLNGEDVGYVCLWSLKKSISPEYVIKTHCSAICANFHPKHGNILAVGLRDGTLAVYNVSLLTSEPQFITHPIKEKHVASVRQVVWCNDFDTGELNFFSVSEDGTVCQWILMKFSLIKIVRAFLHIDNSIKNDTGEQKEKYYAIGTTITFKPDNNDIYLVGTAEGYIFKCNKKWSHLDFVQKFQAHHMPINQIVYNKFNSDIYLTCSEDCMVKIWDDKSEVPLIVFDMETYLSDVCWSPFSSTLFMVLTLMDHKIIVYDLAENLRNPVCKLSVESCSDKYKLIRMAVDRRSPILLIGDSRSTVSIYKLSPYLRTTMKSPKKGIQEPSEILEQRKLQLVLKTILG